MYATNYMERQFLNVMNGIACTAPPVMYLGLYLSDPAETGQGVEISYAGYERQPVTFTVPALANGNISIFNETQITFPTSATEAGTVVYTALSDSKTGGNIWAYGRLTTELVVKTNDAPVFIPNELMYYVTGHLSTAYKEKLLNLFRGQTIQGASPHYALFNGNPNTGGAELAGANYARVPLTFSTPAESATGQMLVSNNETVSFNRPTTDWGLWNYSAIYDKASLGEPIWVIENQTPREILKGYMPTILAGDIVLAIN